MTNGMEDAVWRVLADVDDPEMGISIVELGLIYEVRASEHGANVLMTLTHEACPLGGMLSEEVADRLQVLPFPVEVDLTFDPPWTLQRITSAGRTALAAS